MSETIRHGLPLLAAGQAQKEITHNEALVAIDRKLHLAVESRVVGTPPANPAAGETYIVPAGASGNWQGRTGHIASFDGFGWVFTAPVRGCMAWIADEAVFSVYDNNWSTGGWPADGLRILGREVLSAEPVAVVPPLGGAIVDAECRAAVSQLLLALQDQGIVL